MEEEELKNDELENQDNLSEPSEQSNVSAPSETPSPTENNAPSLNMTNKLGFAKGLASLKALKLLKLKYKIIISGVLLFVAIFLLSILGQEASKVKWDHIDPKCRDVKVNFVNRGEKITLDLESYVMDVVYSLTKDLKNPERVLYQSLSVVVRTNIQAAGSCTVEVTDEVDEYYHFEVLTEDNDRFLAISQSVMDTEGKVMVLNKNFMKANFDSFCYNNVNELEYTVQANIKVPNNWVEENIDNYYFKNCPCNLKDTDLDSCWVEENFPDDPENPERLYVDGGIGLGFSTYGAHYLSSVMGYTDEMLLRFFFPEDWEFHTFKEETKTNNETGGSSCSKINMYKTNLSREDFIRNAEEYNYLGNKNSRTAQYFQSNAGLIYDLGLEVGANPEMVYIIAEKEQGWVDKDFPLKSYNFYGYMVYNGQNSGKYFSSFSDGVRTILNYVKEKGSLNNFTRVYSHLGDFLANPGSWGDGGCIYLKLNDIFGPNYDRCNSSYRCASSKGGPGCVPTTDIERQAYIDWQSKKILKIRSNIFHISNDSCGMAGDTSGTTFLNERIDKFLVSNGTTLEEYNDMILKLGCENLGTGNGVAFTVAQAVSELARYGKKYHYTWGGMHINTGVYGVPAYWGPSGPDCSGLVTWALYQAGFHWRSLGATDWGNQGILTDVGDERARVGDFIVTPRNGQIGEYSHIEIITDISDTEYTVVEAKGDAYGVVFSKVQFSNPDGQKLVLMSDYYQSAPKSETFQQMCLAKGY